MIGVFDSGFGGLTILKNLQKALPQYDYLYLGDNARAPYGSRSFETIFRYTLQAVRELFSRGCPLVILACNTASAKALRSIQQDVLPYEFPDKRVLGIVRPTAEEIGKFSKSGHIGIFGTAGTVSSGSYLIEINHFFPDLKVTQHACPMWVPLVEYGERESEGAKFFVKEGRGYPFERRSGNRYASAGLYPLSASGRSYSSRPPRKGEAGVPGRHCFRKDGGLLETPPGNGMPSYKKWKNPFFDHRYREILRKRGISLWNDRFFG